MVDYAVALQSPSRFQFEDNSGTPDASQTNNCGPACATRHVQFYRNQWYGIEATRRLVHPCCVPTSAWDQADMMDARGVPASVRELNTLSEMHQLLEGGRRPYTIGVLMSRVPASVRDHPFTGWHAIAVIGDGTLGDGTRGFWVNDPNFSPIGGYRPDPDKGKKFYPNAVMKYAFLANSPRYAVVPDKPKPRPQPDKIIVLKDTKLRSSPRISTTNVIRRLLEERTCDLLRTLNGGSYSYLAPDGSTRTSDRWRKVRTPNGQVGFVIRPHTRIP